MYGLLAVSKRLDGFCKDYDEEILTALFDYAVVCTKNDICFAFKAGNEVKVTG
ncbi:MAG: hypothetical protein NC302_06460 [Bacteroidales bacterium]|nr:hypothetical protein [Bacteroidales bacterium]